MGALSRDEVAAASTQRRRTSARKVDTPEFGADSFVFVRRLSIEEMDEAGFFAVRDPNDRKALAGVLPTILLAALSSEDGERLFTDDEKDREVVSAFDFELQIRLFLEVSKVNGIIPDHAETATEEAAEDFDEAQSGSSSTD